MGKPAMYGLHGMPGYKSEGSGRQQTPAVDFAGALSWSMARADRAARGRNRESSTEPCRSSFCAPGLNSGGVTSLFGHTQDADLLGQAQEELPCKTARFPTTVSQYKNWSHRAWRLPPCNLRSWCRHYATSRTVEGVLLLGAMLRDMVTPVTIVGYDPQRDLAELAGCFFARPLKRAYLRTAAQQAGLVHHSDRGIQYCSNQYVEQLESGIKSASA